VTSRLLIVNPAARGGRSAEAQAVAACSAAGITVRVVRTAAPGHAAEIARAETDGAPIFVLGGDGTVMEVVGALVGRDVPVGILPGGTGNQLARHLRIPLHVGRAAKALASAQPVRYDLGKLSDGRYFALAAGLGVDAAMIAGASTTAKRRYGVGAYIWSATRALVAAHPFAVRIVADGKVFEREAGLAMIANVGSVMDGRFSLGPGVSPTDGWLDLCVLSPRGIADGLTLAAKMATGSFREDPRMLFFRAKSIRIEAPEGVGAEADGELLSAPILDATVVSAGASFLAVH
jgi:diacylglycerol kinase (ATP)